MQLTIFEAPDEIHATSTLAFETIWLNEGGAGEGLAVTYWGPALKQGYLQLIHVELGAGVDLERFTALPTLPSPVVRAEFPHRQVAAAVQQPGSGHVTPEFLAAFAKTQVVLSTHATILRAGRTKLMMSVTSKTDVEGDLLELDLTLKR
jgi:hypothetical protein